MKYNKYEHAPKVYKPGKIEVVKIVSEHKGKSLSRRTTYEGREARRPSAGMKRVQAIVRIDGGPMVTRHINVPR